MARRRLDVPLTEADSGEGRDGSGVTALGSVMSAEG